MLKEIHRANLMVSSNRREIPVNQMDLFLGTMYYHNIHPFAETLC